MISSSPPTFSLFHHSMTRLAIRLLHTLLTTFFSKCLPQTNLPHPFLVYIPLLDAFYHSSNLPCMGSIFTSHLLALNVSFLRHLYASNPVFALITILAQLKTCTHQRNPPFVHLTATGIQPACSQNPRSHTLDSMLLIIRDGDPSSKSRHIDEIRAGTRLTSLSHHTITNPLRAMLLGDCDNRSLTLAFLSCNTT
jgi:hypothetical protein